MLGFFTVAAASSWAKILPAISIVRTVITIVFFAIINSYAILIAGLKL
jgi:hypothetical protein